MAEKICKGYPPWVDEGLKSCPDGNRCKWHTHMMNIHGYQMLSDFILKVKVLYMYPGIKFINV